MDFSSKSDWTGLTFGLLGISLMIFIASLTPFNSNVVTAWVLESVYQLFFVLGLCALLIRFAIGYVNKDR